MSQRILAHGWNIDCLAKRYSGLDYRTITEDPNTSSVDGDPYWDGAYFGGTLDPYELVFVKTDRNVPIPEV